MRLPALVRAAALLLAVVALAPPPLLPGVHGVGLQHRSRRGRTASYDSALAGMFTAAPPRSRGSGPAGVPTGLGLARPTRHSDVNAAVLGGGAAAAAAPPPPPPATAFAPPPPLDLDGGASASADRIAADDADDGGSSTAAEAAKRQAHKRVMRKAREAEALTNKLVLGVKSIAAATAGVAHKLMAGDDGLATAAVDLRGELDDLVQHEKLLGETRDVVETSLKEVAAASAAIERAAKVGASARDMATGAAANAALLANAEWRRAIEQLVEVRATMAVALTQAKTRVATARAAAGNGLFGDTATAVQDVRAAADKVKMLRVMADLAAKKIGIERTRALGALKKLKALAQRSLLPRAQGDGGGQGDGDGDGGNGDGGDGDGETQAIDDELAVDKGIVDSLDVAA